MGSRRAWNPGSCEAKAHTKHSHTKLAVVYSIEIYSKPSLCREIYSEQAYIDTAICHMNVMMVNFIY